jgi:acetylornithine/succinyldiaminopimelate/putrescine aminotransferase
MNPDINTLVETHSGRGLELFGKYVNPQLARVLRTIGFSKNYVRAEGPYLYDADGNQYLDFLAGYGVFNMGRNNEVIRNELHKALDANWPSMVQMDAPLLAGLLAERLLSVVNYREPQRDFSPFDKLRAQDNNTDHDSRSASHGALDMVFFTNSGTESNEGAIKFARKATGRTRILFWDHAFHGLTTGSLALNGNEEFRKGFGPLLPGCEAIPFNDLNSLERELKKGDVAAFVIEPVQGKGVYIADTNFYQQAQELCRIHGALFVIDEVQTGFGRTGKWFAHHHWGLKPDIVTVAKSLSGGFVPAGAICYRREIYDKVFCDMESCVVHSNTFGRNALAMTAGLAAIDVIEKNNLVENSARMGEKIVNGLRSMADRYEMISQVRGLGLMVGIEFGKPKSFSLKAGWNIVHSVNKGLFGQMVVVPLMCDHKILTQVAGHNVDIVKILPPLIINESHVERFLNAFEQVMKECHKFPGSAWTIGKKLAAEALRARSIE